MVSIYIYIYTLILQIIGTANYRDVFILREVLSGGEGGSENLKFKSTKYTNYRDVFMIVCVAPYTNYRDVFCSKIIQIIMTFLQQYNWL